MTTTTTPGNDVIHGVAYAVLQEHLSWSWGDWLDHYGGDLADLVGSPYAASVIKAADPDSCLLRPRALARLLAQHGFTVAEQGCIPFSDGSQLGPLFDAVTQGQHGQTIAP